MECRKCRIQYIGKTEKPTLIEQIKSNTKPTLKRQKIILPSENFWITELRTLTLPPPPWSQPRIHLAPEV